MHTILTELNIDLQRRGETLSVAEFVTISNKATTLGDLRP
jgi:16S rRNA A1518/A1519 N6-dimethyltransferase RsmA/KsgA/DIM1 with predicted DNA glycosylase/AP lyase activity